MSTLKLVRAFSALLFWTAGGCVSSQPVEEETSRTGRDLDDDERDASLRDTGDTPTDTRVPDAPADVAEPSDVNGQDSDSTVADTLDAPDGAESPDIAEVSDSSDSSDTPDLSDTADITETSPAACGNARIDSGEECDDGIRNSNTLPNACRTNCRRAHCGDDVLDTGEECDDGNLTDNDQCANSCVPVLGDLCSVCVANEDCGRTQDLCVSLADGRFCGVACSTTADCPTRYACQMIGSASQCMPTSGVCASCFDPDGDGYGIGDDCIAEDCGIPSRAVYPGATEICDGLDNDCDGESDEGFSLTDYWQDLDGDGRGSSSGSPTGACSQPANSSRTNDDCDDSRPTVYPGAAEICDGADNNCNGQADESITSRVWPDSDSDGFGASGDPGRDGCPQIGWVTNADDCNDAVAAVHMGATESCNGRDDDCDGTVDDSAGCPGVQTFRNGSSYLIAPDVLTWSEADSFCQGLGYHLIAPNDADENTWIRSQFSLAPRVCQRTCSYDGDGECDDGGPDSDWDVCAYGTDCTDCGTRGGAANYWLGFNDLGSEGSFVWSGASSGFTNWNGGEPNNSSDEDCAELYGSSGTWNDVECADLRGVMCEAP